MKRTLPAGLRVLVVEDELLVAEEIKERLRRVGVDVVHATDSGESAVSLAERLRPDLVLMDIRLKGSVDGVQAASEIASLDVPVVYVTAHSDARTLERAMGSGPYGYVLKPVRETDLVVAMAAALGRSAVEQLNRDRESLFAATLVSLGEAVLATDLTGSVIFMNPAAESLTACSIADVLGRPADEVVRLELEGDGSPIALGVAEALRTEGPVRRAAARLIAADGRNVPVSATVSRVTRAAGRRVGVVIVIKDLTAEREHEAELRRARESVERAQQMEAIGRFVGGLAHELNNLMTVVVGSCQRLHDGIPVDDDERQLFADVLAAAERASAVTDRLLSSGRRGVSTPSSIELNGAVRNSEDLLRRAVGEGIRLRVETDTESLAANIDGVQLEQVLVNLAVNAREAMPGGGDLLVRTGRTQVDAERACASGSLAPGEWVSLSVRDGGSGMADETKARAFMPFVSTKPNGHGLGLAVVAGIVEQAGGAIEVHSTRDRGTEFVVHLPFGSGSPEAGVEASVIDPRTAKPGAAVLLVEDEPTVLRLASVVLEEDGHTVHEATSGEQALDLAEHVGPLDLLVTDVVLPGINGREVIEGVRALHPEIAVLVVSGHADDGPLRREVRDGGFSFLAKPFSTRDLTSKAREAMGARDHVPGPRKESDS